jgi:hypothetical protein
MAEKKNIELPFKWSGQDPVIAEDKMINDRMGKKTKHQYIFEPIRATIVYKGKPQKEGMQYSWKFKEDITEDGSGYTGNFWRTWDYETTDWSEPDCEIDHEDAGHDEECTGFEKNAIVDVVFKVEEKKTGAGWFYNIESMERIIPEPDESQKPKAIAESNGAIKENAPKVLNTDQRICKSVSFNNATILIAACIKNPENAKKVLGPYSKMLPGLIDDWEYNYVKGMEGSSPNQNPLGDLQEIEFWKGDDD